MRSLQLLGVLVNINTLVDNVLSSQSQLQQRPMLIYFPSVEYTPDLPFYVKPSGEPQLPHRFENKQHLELYYDRVKCFVQLAHDGTKDGCRKLLKRYIHRDHQRLVKLVKKYFYVGVEGRKDERVRSFWSEWHRIVKRLKVDTIVNTPPEKRPKRCLKHFAEKMKSFPEQTPETFLRDNLTNLQEIIVQWPSSKHIEVLLSVLSSHNVIFEHIRHSQVLKSSLKINYSLSQAATSDGSLIPMFALSPDVNVLDFMRRLTNELIEASLILHESVKASNTPPHSTAHLFKDVTTTFNDLSRMELKLPHKGESVLYPSSKHPPTTEISRPVKPRSFTSSEHCRWYYAHVKKYIQLAHNGSISGFRELLLHYIHPDQETTLSILARAYGAGHQTDCVCRGCFHCKYAQFWEEWCKLLDGQTKKYISDPGLVSVVSKAIAKFEKRMKELKEIKRPMELYKKEMKTIQKAMEMFPDSKLLERLVNSMVDHFPAGVVLEGLEDCFIQTEGKVYINSEVCVVTFMSELTHRVIQWTDSFSAKTEDDTDRLEQTLSPLLSPSKRKSITIE